MASVSESEQTRFWVDFFTESGIPKNVAANYAVTFVDNRIGKSMLLDLNKEILQDVGVTAMGDVIAILKHAKIIHAQMTREKVFREEDRSRLRVSLAKPPEVDRFGSPSERTFTSAGGTRAQVGVKRKADVEVSPQAGSSKRKVPAYEGGYSVSMPTGTTSKTRKLLQEQPQPGPTWVRTNALSGRKQQSSSVFERLDQKVSSSTTFAKKPAATTVTQVMTSSSVFDRLGPETGHVSSTTSAASPSLPYKGVLKTPSPQKSAVTAKRLVKRAIGPITPGMSKASGGTKEPTATRLGPSRKTVTFGLEMRRGMKRTQQPVLQAATVTSCSEGILATGASSKTSGSLQTRLGKTTIVKLNQASKTIRKKPTLTIKASNKAMKKLAKTFKPRDVFSRLGPALRR